MRTEGSRIALLRERMHHEQIDLAVVGPTSRLVWLTGLAPHGDERPVLLFVGPKDAGLLVPQVNAAGQRDATELRFNTWSDGDGPDLALGRLIEDVAVSGPGRVVALDEAMRAGFAMLVLDRLAGYAPTSLDRVLSPLRICKDDSGYSTLKTGALINDGAMTAALRSLRPGTTEQAAAFFRKNGAHPESVSVCFGENTAFPHHISGRRVLGADDTVLIDLCGRFDGYCSDMTRVAAIGRAPAGFVEASCVVEEAVLAAVSAIRPGTMAREIDEAAREVIRQAGFGAFFVHRTGHGVGLDIHEPPSMAAGSDVTIHDGMAFSVEPGIYIPGRFGVRLEEVVYVRDGRAEFLFGLPRACTLVEADRL